MKYQHQLQGRLRIMSAIKRSSCSSSCSSSSFSAPAPSPPSTSDSYSYYYYYYVYNCEYFIVNAPIMCDVDQQTSSIHSRL